MNCRPFYYGCWSDVRRSVTPRRTRLLGNVLVGLMMLATACGCGKPQAAPQNRMAISSLRTAVNTRNAQWLEKNAQIVEERRLAGQMADDE